MGQVSVILNGRSYRFVVDSSDEKQLSERASYLQAEIAKVGEEFLDVRDERLLVMAALRIVDDLFESRRLNIEMLTSSSQIPMPVAESPADINLAKRPARRTST